MAAKRKKNRRGFGSSPESHAVEAQNNGAEAVAAARDAISVAKAGRCGDALDALFDASYAAGKAQSHAFASYLMPDAQHDLREKGLEANSKASMGFRDAKDEVQKYCKISRR